MNKSWRQHPTKHQLYGHLPPITKTIQVRRTRYAGHCWRSKMYSYGPPHMAEQKQDDQLEHTYSSSVRIRDVALKTSQRRWTIGRSGERGSGISVLAARHDDDDDDDVCCRLRNRWRDLYSERGLLLAPLASRIVRDELTLWSAACLWLDWFSVFCLNLTTWLSRGLLPVTHLLNLTALTRCRPTVY